jgi:hypothetical protein
VNAKLATAAVAVVAAVSGFVGHQLNNHPKVQAALTDTAVDIEGTRYFRAAGFSCGIEFWDTKVMRDPTTATHQGADTVNLTPVKTNIPALIQLSGPAGRRPAQQAMSLSGARLTAYKQEPDSDIHLVLTSTLASHPTMIAEIPDPQCAANSRVLAQITAARAAFVAQVGPPQTSFVQTNVSVNLTGIPFTDVAHGQTGADPNQTELHPIVAFRRNP